MFDSALQQGCLGGGAREDLCPQKFYLLLLMPFFSGYSAQDISAQKGHYYSYHR